MPDPITGIIGGSSLLGASSANKAAKAGTAAAANELQLQERVYDEGVGRLSPYTDAGQNALAAYMYELGLGPAPTIGGTSAPNYSIEEIQGQGTLQPIKDTGDGVEMVYGPSTFKVGGQTFNSRDEAQAWIDAQPQSTGGTTYPGMSLSPQAQFLLTQGRDTIEAGAAANGGLYSGATLKALDEHRMNVAQTDRDNQLSRLLGLTQIGQASATGSNAAGTNFAAGASGAIASGANAKMAGAIGTSNAINNGLSNYLGYQTFNNLIAQKAA